MIYRYILSIIFIIISVFIMNKANVNIIEKNFEIPEFKISYLENPIIRKDISSDDISEILFKLKNENGVIISKLILSKKDFFDNDYDLYIERQIPENAEAMDIKTNNQKSYEEFFQNIDFNVYKLWREKNFLPKSELLDFAGVVEEKGELIGYAYIGNKLITLKDGEVKKNKRIIKIFKDGILLYDNVKKRFEVLK